MLFLKTVDNWGVVLSPLIRGVQGCVINKIFYNSKLNNFAKQLRNNSSKAEIIFWNYLKGKQLMGYDFHRQKPIDNYVVDFFCNKLMLAIEVDGYTHTFEKTIDKDTVKAKRLEKLGITVLRFSDDDVLTNIEGVLQSLRNFILRSGKQLTAHTPQSPLDRGEDKTNES